MNDKWDKLKTYVTYRLSYLNDADPSIYIRGKIDAYKVFEKMMNELEENEPMYDKLWIEVPFNEALQTWADGYDIRCMIDNEYLKYEKAKLAYDTLRDECGSPPSALEILSGVWTYRKED